MIEGKNISKDFVSRKIFLLLAIAVILILLGIHFWIKSSSDISVKDAEKQIEENLRAAVLTMAMAATMIGGCGNSTDRKQ